MEKKRRRIIAGGIIVLVLTVGVIGARIWLKSKYIIPVLMYHHVDENWQKSKLSVSPESFKRQMEFLKKRGYNVISMAGLINAVKSGQRLPAKTVAITFDDGYEDNYLNAFPILKEAGVQATMFIAVNHLGREGYMNWEQVKELSASRVIDIGSHTLNHAWLPAQDDEALIREIAGSKERLEKETGHAVKVLSYPLGGFNEKVRKVTEEAGYAGACATNPEIDFKDGGRKHDPYAMARNRISRTSDNLLVFAIEISGYYNWIKSIRDEK